MMSVVGVVVKASIWSTEVWDGCFREYVWSPELCWGKSNPQQRASSRPNNPSANCQIRKQSVSRQRYSEQLQLTSHYLGTPSICQLRCAHDVDLKHQLKSQLQLTPDLVVV
jgi:hypothetical protein